MSDFLAEARIIVRPDTTKFRAELVSELAVATRGVTVPVTVTPVVTTTGAAAASAQSAATTAALAAQRVEQERLGAQSERSARQTREFTQTQGELRKGVVASAAGLTGLRGAVLAASAPFLLATVGITAFSRAVQSAADLETDLNVFRVTARATAQEMEAVREQAKLLGRDLTLPGVTATDAAETFLTLSRAGLSVQNSLAGARGTLQLAVAAQISFADAAQLTASALNAFSLSGSSAIDVADLLTNAANSSQASIADMGIALRQSAAIADLAGFSLSETATFLTQLAQAGLSGSDAGTSFRVAIQRLIAPTGAARKELEKLNVNLRDAEGNLRPEAFFELGDALERMGRAQADATRQLIFGNDASRAAAFFARINAQAFREQEKALSQEGAAAEVAGARNEGFAGKVENAKNQLAAFGIELGELSLPAAGVAVDGLALFFGALATQISDTRTEFAKFGDDAEQIQTFLTDISNDSGFTDFAKTVASGARLISGDIQRASDATDAFVGNLLGLGGRAQEATTGVHELTQEEARLAESIHDAVRPTVEQTTSFDDLAAAAQRAAQAVAALQGQERGLEEQVTRARIAGDQAGELDALRAQREALEKELAAQESIIARPGTAGEATAREAIRQRILPQLEAVNNEINNIIQEQTTTNQRLADDAARAANERDSNLLDALSGRRADAERRISAAADTEGVADDIRAQDRLQALIKQQIQKVRDLITDEKTRKAAIRELRIALIASRQEEDALRRERAQEQATARETGIDLDIQFAETTGNVAREVAARERLIALLRKQQRAVKKGTNEWKRLRNEIAEQQQAIKDARKQADESDDDGKSAQQFFFEQLQAQQGFASNLLGNLITGSTEGLVGVPASTTTGPGRGIEVAASVQEGKQRGGPTAGQANTTNDILLRILEQLRNLNDDREHPEATRQRRKQMAVMDFEHGQGGVM